MVMPPSPIVCVNKISHYLAQKKRKPKKKKETNIGKYINYLPLTSNLEHKNDTMRYGYIVECTVFIFYERPSYGFRDQNDIVLKRCTYNDRLSKSHSSLSTSSLEL